MSNTIDKRVVEMGFDNAQFESGVKTSLKTVDQLKKGLNFEGSGKGLLGITNLMNGIPLGGISEGVNNISSKFSLFGAIGFAAIQNIVGKVIDLTQRLWNMVSPINAIKQGMAEYETQINAVQTILANTSMKGTTMEDVTRALDELNTYADKTIYNFSEMTRNIGTFTAAGIDLDVSVAAIKGIANLAAVSGSNSQQASVAMYQLSQALSTGTVRLMDWNSVVNAGMGGQVFQDALKQTARAHGIAVDDIIKQEGSFRESLAKGWLTSSVLTETLSKFTGDLNAQQLKTMGYTETQIRQIIELGKTASDAATKVKTFTQLKDTIQEAIGSGWAKSWQIVVGDFEEAKAFFTSVSDSLGSYIQQSSEARNNLLQAWKDAGGRKALVKGVELAFSGVLSIIKPIKEAFSEIFPPVTAQRLLYLSLLLTQFARNLNLNGVAALKVKMLFKGLFAVFDILRMLVVALVKPFISLGKAMAPAGSSLLDYLLTFSSYILRLREGIKATDAFNVFIQKIIDRFGLAREEITAFIATLKSKFNLIQPYLAQVKTAFLGFFSDFSNKFIEIRTWLSSIFDNVDISGVDNFFGKVGKRFEPLKSIGELIGKVISGIINVMKKIMPIFFSLASGVSKVMFEFAKAIGDAIVNLDFSKVFDMINAGVLTAIILGIRKFIGSGTKALDNVGDMFGNIKGALAGVTGILDGVRGSLQAWQENLKAKTLLTLATAIAVLAVSLVAISLIDSKKLSTALLGISALFADLVASMAILDKATGGTGKGIVIVSGALVAMSVAILILSAAVVSLSRIDPKDLSKALGALANMTAALVIFAKIMQKNTGSFIKASVSLILLTVALELLVNVVKRLGDIDAKNLTKGLIAVGVLLGELAIFMRTGDFNNLGIGKGLGLLAMAAAVLVLSSVVEKFANMKVEELQKGLGAIGLLFAELALFTRLTGDSKKVISTSVGITILAAALVIMTNVITTLGNLSWDVITKGLTAMGAALLIVVLAMNSMPKNMIVNAASLVLIAGSLVVLGKALEDMGNMSWEEIGKSLLTLAASLTILAVAMQAMQSGIGGAAAMLIMSAALAIFVPTLVTLGNMSISEIGIGLIALAGAFTILGIAGYALTPVVPTLLGLAGAVVLIGIAIAAIGAGILMFSSGLAALAISGAAGAAALVVIVTTMLGLVPMIVTVIVNAITQFIKLIGDALPVIITAFEKILLALIGVIANVTPPLIDALLELLLNLINLINKAGPPFIEAVFNLLSVLLRTLADRVPEFIQSGIDIILGLLKGIRDNIAEIVTVAIDIVTNFIDAVAKKLPDVIDSGWNLIISFIDGLAKSVDENGDDLQAAVGRLAKAIIDGLANGLKSGVGAVANAIASLAGAAISALKLLLGIKSPSTVFTELGKDTSQGFINGLLKMGTNIEKAAASIGTSAINGIEEAIGTITDALDTNMEFAPTIRPVVDLTEIISGSKQIDGLLTRKSLTVSGITSNISSISNGLSNNVGQNQQNLTNPQSSSISLTQINNSPVPLSRMEIYRQTKNQMLMLKGLVKNPSG